MYLQRAFFDVRRSVELELSCVSSRLDEVDLAALIVLEC